MSVTKSNFSSHAAHPLLFAVFGYSIQSEGTAEREPLLPGRRGGALASCAAAPPVYLQQRQRQRQRPVHSCTIARVCCSHKVRTEAIDRTPTCACALVPLCRSSATARAHTAASKTGARGCNMTLAVSCCTRRTPILAHRTCLSAQSPLPPGEVFVLFFSAASSWCHAS